MQLVILAMSATSTAWLTAAGVFALVDWWGVLAERERVRWVGKPMTMIALIAAAVSRNGDAGRSPGVSRWIIVGLVLSLVGDVCLQMPDRDRWFIRGLAAFLVAHIAYVIACFAVGVGARSFGVAIIVLALAMAFLGIRVIQGATRRSPRLQRPVRLYVMVISLMVAAAVGTGEWWLIAAAALFYVSDSVLGWNAFVQPKRWMPLTVMITYHLAQFGFTAFLIVGGSR